MPVKTSHSGTKRPTRASADSIRMDLRCFLQFVITVKMEEEIKNLVKKLSYTNRHGDRQALKEVTIIALTTFGKQFAFGLD